MPAELMLRNMRLFDRAAQSEIKAESRKAAKARDFSKAYDLLGRAHACAVDCAPYYHARLAALAALRQPDPSQTTLEQMLIAMTELMEPANDDGAPMIEGSVIEAE